MALIAPSPDHSPVPPTGCAADLAAAAHGLQAERAKTPRLSPTNNAPEPLATSPQVASVVTVDAADLLAIIDRRVEELKRRAAEFSRANAANPFGSSDQKNQAHADIEEKHHLLALGAAIQQQGGKCRYREGKIWVPAFIRGVRPEPDQLLFDIEPQTGNDAFRTILVEMNKIQAPKGPTNPVAAQRAALKQAPTANPTR